MTTDELLNATREYNVKLMEFGERKALHTRLHTTFAEADDMLLELEVLLERVQTALHGCREKALGEAA
jgi:hypothetical protein